MFPMPYATGWYYLICDNLPVKNLAPVFLHRGFSFTEFSDSYHLIQFVWHISIMPTQLSLDLNFSFAMICKIMEALRSALYMAGDSEFEHVTIVLKIGENTHVIVRSSE